MVADADRHEIDRAAILGSYVPVSFPGRGTEKWGARPWREYLNKLNQAGFDVLTFDKRGHGISGGLTPDNTLQQGSTCCARSRPSRPATACAHLGPTASCGPVSRQFANWFLPARGVIEAARRKLTHIVLRPTSEAVAGIGSWPAVFFGKGIWDENQGPFPTFNAYLRVRGARELLFVRGPHSENDL